MKIRAIFFFLILALVTIELSAQEYHGVNTAEITASGTQQTTQLQSRQWVCEYNMGNSILDMKAKMAAFGFEADGTGKSILSQVFYVDANPLIQVFVDFSQLMIQGGSTREESLVNLPVEVRFNERRVHAQAQIQALRVNAQSLEMNLEIPLNLREFGLTAGDKYANSFSDDFSLKVSQLQMKAR